MRDALVDIKALTADGKEAFETDRSAQQAVAYNLAVLGEAARVLSTSLRERRTEVPWRDVIAQRNVVVHEYHRLDLDIAAPPRVSACRLMSSPRLELPS
jgi:uncharacterized protein with HEPN domain